MFIDSLCVAFLALFAGAVDSFSVAAIIRESRAPSLPVSSPGFWIGIPAFQSGQLGSGSVLCRQRRNRLVLAACLPENNVIKHLSREQGSLVISAGSYQLGRRKRD